MMIPLRTLAVITGVTLAASAAAQPAGEGLPAPPAYRPGLGDLMITSQLSRCVVGWHNA